MRRAPDRTFWALALVAFVLVAAPRAAAQQTTMPPGTARDATRPAPQPLGTGLIAGALVAVDTGKPVRQARVTLSGGDTRMSKTVTTDDQGAFSFAELPAGSFTLTASRP